MGDVKVKGAWISLIGRIKRKGNYAFAYASYRFLDAFGELHSAELG